MKGIIKYLVLNAVRNRVFLGLNLFLILSIAFAVFLSTTAFVEQQQFATVYVAGISRLVVQFGLILFCCLAVNRAFENKEVEFVISKSISRERFILSYFLGFAVVALLVVIPLFIIMFLLCKMNYLGFAIWAGTFFGETLLLICFAILSSLILRSNFNAIFASCGFYIVSRLMAMFTMSIDQTLNNVLQAHDNRLVIMCKFILQTMSAVFPRLDLFAQSKWLVYGIENSSFIKIVVYQFLIYLPLLIIMSFHDFRKKQF